MRTHLLLVSLFCLGLSWGCQPQVDVDAEAAGVRAALDAYVAAVEAEDMAQYGEAVAHEQAVMHFGAFGAPIAGWDALQEVMAGQNAMLDSIRIEQSDVAVHVLPSGDWAWATSLWDFTAMMGEESMALPVRCTWILEKRADGWKVVHFHKSVSAG